MVEDEAIEDHKISDLHPSQETSARSDAIDVMSWDIESEIVHSSEIR